MIAKLRAQFAQTAFVYGHFRKDVAKRKRKLAAGGAFAVLYAVARVAEPWPLKVVFDQVLFHKKGHGFLFAPFTVFGSSATELLTAAGVLLALIGIVRGLSYYYEDYLLSSAAQEIVYDIRRRLYRHLHALPVSFHRNRPTGDTLVRLSSDIVVLRDMLVDSVVNLGTSVVLLVLMLTVMLIVDPVLTVVSTVVLPVIVFLGAYYAGRIRVNSRRQRKREGEVATVMHEALSAMDVVQLHGASEREQARFHAINRRSLKQGVRATRLEARMNRGVEFALAAGTVIVLWVGTLRALHGAVTPGELIVFVSYLRASYRPLRRASKTLQRSTKALAAAERIVDVLATSPELVDLPDARPAPRFAGRIAFEDVDYAYRDGEPVLHGASFAVDAGGTAVVVGATGSGKSTLIGLIPRLFDPSGGRVTIDGTDIREFTLESLREQVSVVQQETVLFGVSIAENIRYGRPDATDAEVEAAARATGLDRLIARLPHGYDTVLVERGASLSGGQKQLIALARALVRQAPILVLDEPTTGLDTVSRAQVVEALKSLPEDTTTIVVTHDMRLVHDATQIVVVDGGEIVAVGTYDELLQSSARFRELNGTVLTATPRRPARRAGAPAADGPRVLFYSHNGVGVGHLQRQLDLARAYRDRHPDSSVLLTTGSHAASMFEFPDGIDHVKLPSLVMVDRYRTWEPRDLGVDRDDVVALRARILEETVSHFGPDLLVADFMPRGPFDELLPSLEALDRRGGVAVAGFRDIVDEPAFVRELWDETGVYETLREHYAAICVYGATTVVDFARDYGVHGELEDRLVYCGYLGRRGEQIADVPLYERPFVLATCGGGVDGGPLIDAFVRAAGQLRESVGGTWLAVSGPLMDYEEHSWLAWSAESVGATVLRSVSDLRGHVALADCLVAMPGYNTVCDVLSFKRRAVLVPRESHSREQAMRAEFMQAVGAAQTVSHDELDRGSLVPAIQAALDLDTPPDSPVPLDGLGRAVDAFDNALSRIPVSS